MSATEVADISCPFTQLQADLIHVPLFLLLSPFEYTKTKSHRRMVQFRIKDFQFHYADGVVPHNAPSKTFLRAWAITLFLYIQKDSIQGKSR